SHARHHRQSLLPLHGAPLRAFLFSFCAHGHLQHLDSFPTRRSSDLHLILLRCRICVYELCIEGRGKTWKLKGLMKTQLSFTSLMYILRIAVLKEKIFGIIASVVYNYFGK